MYQTLWRPRGLRLSRILGVPVLLRYGRQFGVIPDRDLSVLLDMSGYRYADRWGLDALNISAKEYADCQRAGKRVIMLPQAFGPFEVSESRAAIRRLVSHTDLVYARDSFSFRQLLEACGDSPALRQAPEFTQILPAREPTKPCVSADCVALVPNIQVVRQQKGVTFELYLAFWSRVVSVVRRLGFEPVVVQFSRIADSGIVDAISSANGVRVVRNQDPLVLKWAVGACRAAVTSRFHALVCACSQGVPVATTAWSHKYHEFAREYGMEAYGVSVKSEDGQLFEILGRLCVSERDEISKRLKEIAQVQASRVHAMWLEIAHHIGVEMASGGSTANARDVGGVRSTL